jgi:predicted DNA-binding transcriptional regulator YafY
LKTGRLASILYILANTDKITVKELADRFETSERTIQRDLAILSCAGIKIESRSGHGGGIHILEKHKFNKNILSTDDTKKIFTGLNALKSIDSDNSITNLIAKLIPEKEATAFSKSEYAIDFSAWFPNDITAKKMSDLHKAITDQHCIRIEYISTDSRIERIIEPYKLVFKQSNWYLYAFCRKRKGFRLFKINRIASYDVLEETFQVQPIEKIEMLQNSEADIFNSKDKTTLFEIVLEYDKADEFYLTYKIDACFLKRSIKNHDAKGQIRFKVSDLNWAADFVFSILDKVKIISPIELKATVERKLNKIHSFYKGDI